MMRLAGFLLCLVLSCALMSATWIQRADRPCANVFGVGLSIGNCGYYSVGFGCIPTPTNGFLWKYSPGTNSWTQSSLSPSTTFDDRLDAFGFSIGGKGYLGCGTDGPVTYSWKDLWEYDTLIGTWTQKADFGGGFRRRASSFVLGGKGYVGTGEYYDNFNMLYYQYKDLWEYDPSLNTWIQKANLPDSSRVYSVGFAFNNRGYLGLGTHNGSPINDLWQYDPIGDSWTQRSNFPGQGRKGITTFMINSNAFVTSGNTSSVYLNDFWRYDCISDSWVQLPNIPFVPRQYYFSFSLNGKGYIGGGIDSNNVIQVEFWEYTDSLLSNLEANNNSFRTHLYPNPFTTNTTIEIEESMIKDGADLMIYNVSGEKVKELKIRNAKTVIGREDLSDGIYFYQLRSGDSIISTGKLIMQ